MHLLCRLIGLQILLSVLLARLTQSMPAINSLPTHPIYSLPPLHPTVPLNASSNGNCASTAKFPSWTSPDWVVEDCYTAVQQLYINEVLVHPNVKYKFLAKGLSPTKPPPESQRTPRKYIVRSCVLTIMMLDWFPPGYLPGAKAYNREQSDISTYQDIWSAAKSIETACTIAKSPGWLMTGKDSAMGIFIWSTKSHINEETGGFPVQSFDLNDSEAVLLDDVRTS